MTETSTKLRHREILWTSVAIGAFSVTGWTYSNIGFIQSFLPLLIGIFALRRILALEMATGAESTDLVQKYEIDPDRDYTDDEQIEILSEVDHEFAQKGRIWGALAAITAVVGAVAVSVSLALTVVCTVVAGYCLVRYARIRRLRRHLDERIGMLAEE